MKFEEKPVVIDAMQFTEESKNVVFHWMAGTSHYADFDEENKPVMRIKNLEGVVTANIGDWIIRGVAGDYYPCKPEVFEKIMNRSKEGM